MVGAAVAQEAGAMTHAPAPKPPAIVLRGLRKSFGTQVAVDDLDLEVPSGQILALLGPNGAGKSTTTEMILGLQNPDAGTVQVCGMQPALAAQQGLVGAMLQGGALLENMPVGSILKLVAGVCAHPLPVDLVCEQADVTGLLRKKTSRLSGGEAQRVRFALALLPDPDVILLDEPTVGMDVEARRRFWQRMRQVAEGGRTIIFATHYLEEADQQAARIVVLDEGRIVADGTGHEIKARRGDKAVIVRVPDPDGCAHLAEMAGVTAVELLDDGRLRLASSDSDATLRALFAADGPACTGLASDVEVHAPSLEDAFVAITSHQPDTAQEALS
jgi:ABC-2 type transport system ATP-binding protein